MADEKKKKRFVDEVQELGEPLTKEHGTADFEMEAFVYERGMFLRNQMFDAEDANYEINVANAFGSGIYIDVKHKPTDTQRQFILPPRKVVEAAVDMFIRQMENEETEATEAEDGSDG